MKKTMKLLLILFVLLFGITPVCTFAEQASTLEEVLQLSEDWLVPALGEGAEHFSSLDFANSPNDIKGIVNWVLDTFSSQTGSITTFLTTALLLMLLGFLTKVFSEKGVCDTVSTGICLSMALLLGTLLQKALESVSAYLQRLYVLLSSFSAISVGLYAAGGSELTASASALSLSLTLQVLATVTAKVLPACIGVSFLLGLCASVSDIPVFAGVSKLFRNVLYFGIGVLGMVFSCITALQQQLAQAKDGISARAVKFVLARAVPLVGGTVSEAVRTVMAGVSAAKSSVGTAGIFAIVFLVFTPLCMLLLYKWIFSAGKSICDSFELQRCSTLFAQTEATTGLLLAILALFTAIAALHLLLLLHSTATLGGIT